MQETDHGVIEGLLYAYAKGSKTSILAESSEAMFNRDYEEVDFKLKLNCSISMDVITCTDLCGFEIDF